MSGFVVTVPKIPQQTVQNCLGPHGNEANSLGKPRVSPSLALFLLE